MPTLPHTKKDADQKALWVAEGRHCDIAYISEIDLERQYMQYVAMNIPQKARIDEIRILAESHAMRLALFSHVNYYTIRYAYYIQFIRSICDMYAIELQMHTFYHALTHSHSTDAQWQALAKIERRYKKACKYVDHIRQIYVNACDNIG